MVHRREVDGEPIALGNQGALFGNALTMWDHDTGSVWSQISGEALLGPLAGMRLELLPSTLTEWGTWQREHPTTRALDADPGRSGFHIDDMHIAIEVGDEALAVAVADLRNEGVINVEVGGLSLAVVAEPAPGGWWAAFSRRLDERTVTFELRDGELHEVGGQGRWDASRGLPRDGEQRLDPVGALTIFESDFRTHFRGGRIWPDANS